MKWCCIFLMAVTAWGQAEIVAGAARAGMPKRKRRTPQAVVEARQKLRRIADGPRERRRQNLRDTLELLLLDFGVDPARPRANDLIEGNYAFLRALPSNDRAALASVVGDLVTLFPLPSDKGVVKRLLPKLNALLTLQSDENPTVAARAKRLVEMVRGSSLSFEPGATAERDAQSVYWMNLGNAFIKQGRRGLLHYSVFSKRMLSELTKRRRELEELTHHAKPVVVERAQYLLRVIDGQEVTERTVDSLAQFARGFLKRGVAGLEDYTEVSDELLAALMSRRTELETLAKDGNTTVSRRALLLLKAAHRESDPGIAGSTLNLLGNAFLEVGKAGLLHGLPLSEDAVVGLVRRLPEIEQLASDHDETVRERAKWLIQVAYGKNALGPPGVELRGLALAFFQDGRAGLRQGRPLNKTQLTLLEKKLPDLEVLAKDQVPAVAQRAQWLIHLVKKRELAGRSVNTLTMMARAYLKRGRAGLLDYEHQPVSEEQRTQLTKRRPELEALSRDPIKRVASRAQQLMRILEGKEDPNGAQVARIAAAYLDRGRDGLLTYDGIGDVQRRKLLQKVPLLETFAKDPDPKVAQRAELLIRVANQQEVANRTIGNLQQLMSAFMRRGRSGLLDYEAVTDEKIELLNAQLPVLDRLAKDPSPKVAELAGVLKKVAHREETPYSGAHLKKITNAFLKKGRASLLSYGGPSPAQLEKLNLKLDLLEKLSKDENGDVATRAEALIAAVKGEGETGITSYRLRQMASDFIKRGRSGLLGADGINEELSAKLRHELPLLERLANDENADVADRARLLILVANGEAPDRLAATTQMHLASAFLRFGRAGLLDYHPVTQRQVRELKKRLPALEELLSDENPWVVERAKMLMDAANGLRLTGPKTSSMRMTAVAFLRYGRAGLAAMLKPRGAD